MGRREISQSRKLPKPKTVQVRKVEMGNEIRRQREKKGKKERQGRWQSGIRWERERGRERVDKRVICQCYFLLAGSLVECGPGTLFYFIFWKKRKEIK